MMAKTNLAQLGQHLKSLETTTQEIDQSYQQVVDPHKQMYGGLCDLSNLIFELFRIVRDLREIHLELEKGSQ